MYTVCMSWRACAEECAEGNSPIGIYLHSVVNIAPAVFNKRYALTPGCVQHFLFNTALYVCFMLARLRCEVCRGV